MFPGACNGMASSWMSRGFHSFHPGGTVSLLCDGSVRFVPETVDLRVTTPWAAAPGANRSASISKGNDGSHRRRIQILPKNLGMTAQCSTALTGCDSVSS